MAEWIIPCNTKIYRVSDAFKELQIIDWRQTQNIKSAQVGDFIYIYASSPISKILYKGAILAVNKSECTYDDSAYSIPPGSVPEGPFMEIALFRVYDIDGLDYASLKANGLTSFLMGPYKIKEPLANYIHACDSWQRNSNRFLGDIPDECLVPFPLNLKDEEVDINIPLSPLSVSEDGKTAVCRNCGNQFELAKRCPHCGQLLVEESELHIEEDNNMLSIKQIEALYTEYGILFNSVKKPYRIMGVKKGGSSLNLKKNSYAIYSTSEDFIRICQADLDATDLVLKENGNAVDPVRPHTVKCSTVSTLRALLQIYAMNDFNTGK